MINPIVDRSVTEQLREDLDKAIQQGAFDLVLNNTDRRAGRVQGLIDAMQMLETLIQRTNDQRSSQQVN